MGNTESNSNNTGGGQNNRNQSNRSWTEIASDVADLCTKLSSSSSGTFPNSNSQFLGLPSSSSSASAAVSDSTAGWRFPEKGWIKCNVDGSFLPEKRSAGCGGVYRDARGNWLYGFSKKLVYNNLTTAEIDAIYTGLKVAWELGYKKIIIESDSTAAVDHVNKSVPSSHYLAETVNQARDYLNKHWEEIKIVYLPRDYNKVADKLADVSHDLLVGTLKPYYDVPVFCSKFHSNDVSRANSLPMSNDSYSWTDIAAGVASAAVIAGGLYSVLSSSSPSSSSSSSSVRGFDSSSARGFDHSGAGWQFPPMGWVKCNVDGSFLPEKRSAGCGGVYRDAQGKWLYGFAQRMDYYDITKAETFAIYKGLAEAWRLGYKRVIIESDSTSAAELVNQGSSTSDSGLGLLVNQAREYVNKDWEVEILCISRDYNKVADKLASLSHVFQVGVLKEYEDPPQPCIYYLSDGVSGKRR
ncbi:hypothetical protein L6164_026546 [Bauhinia variegata]|uniref:Uncharacterized protein n=1 Tax=Bauhinia variegata TaxID=167791 RepID=A0ACB9LQT3_BAUVA|nr:hypothetical protein L6164_026546 [Bauhinia variegata]